MTIAIALPSTSLKGAELCRLTAVITGGATKRAATTAAAWTRLLNVADQFGLPGEKVARIVEKATDLTAAEDSLRALIESATVTAASAVAILAPSSGVKIGKPGPVKTDDEMPDFMHRTGDPAEEAAVADHWRKVSERNRAAQEEEMRKNVETKKPTSAAKPRAKREPGATNKNGLIASLLIRPEGCTCADILEATGWPTVSVPQQAKIAKLTLRKEKLKGEPTRYWGKPVKAAK